MLWTKNWTPPARTPARHGWSHMSHLRRAYKKEKLLFTNNFSFFHGLFKRLVLQTRKNQGLFGRGLNRNEEKSKSWSTVMVVVLLILDFWKRLPNSLEHALKSSEEFGTYLKTILYRRIVFIIVDSLFQVIISVRSSMFQMYLFKAMVPTVLCIFSQNFT